MERLIGGCDRHCGHLYFYCESRRLLWLLFSQKTWLRDAFRDEWLTDGARGASLTGLMALAD
jgi:hypothetical protein